MIPRFDPDAPFADDLGMGYSTYTTEFRIECVRRYFAPPRISLRLLALEKGVPFHTLQDWVRKAKKAGMLGSDESLPAMVEVAMPPARADEAAKAPEANPATATITIGKATVTLPAPMLAEALEALLRQ